MSSNDKAAAAYHPLDDEFADALVGENPCIPPFMDRAMALAGPNARSAAAAVFDAIAATDEAVKHAKNLQAAVNDIRELVDNQYTRYPFADIREILERHGV